MGKKIERPTKAPFKRLLDRDKRAPWETTDPQVLRVVGTGGSGGRLNTEVYPETVTRTKVREGARGLRLAELQAKPCRGADGGKKGLRPCHLELEFFGLASAARLGVEPGAYLRVCAKKNTPGLLVPVTSAEEANVKARAICACAEARGGGHKAAVTCGYEELPAGAKAAFGGLGRVGRR